MELGVKSSTYVFILTSEKNSKGAESISYKGTH